MKAQSSLSCAKTKTASEWKFDKSMSVSIKSWMETLWGFDESKWVQQFCSGSILILKEDRVSPRWSHVLNQSSDTWEPHVPPCFSSRQEYNNTKKGYY